MRILISGCRGMVGSALVRELSEHELITPSKYMMNVGNKNQVLGFKSENPEFIVHLAAETDHEYCEENPSQCYFINAIGTSYMVELAKSLNVPILYVSAGSIFDGKKLSPYTVVDTPNPMNHYNTSKWFGELIVRQYPKHYILRAGWMFGGGEGTDKKFVSKIMKKIRRGDKEIKVCDDCIGSPTYNVDFARSIRHIIESGSLFYTYHSCNSSTGVSRYEFAEEIVKILGSDVKIVPCKIDDLKEEFPCKRTNYEVIESNFEEQDWKLALKEYIDVYYRN